MSETREPILRIPPLAIGSWLPIAKKSWPRDIIAGLTLWGMIVPGVIAYSELAGVPASAGLWAIVLVLPFYALWGSSRFLVATPTAAIGVTMGSVVAQMNGMKPTQAVAALTLGVGVIFLVGWLFRAGFIVNFISQPVNQGFLFGLAFFIATSQLHKLFGISGTQGNTIDRWVDLIKNLGDTNWVTVALSGFCAVVLFGLPKLLPKFPAGLVMIFSAALLVSGFNLVDRYQVKTAGAITSGPPSIVLPSLALSEWGMVLVYAAGVMLVGISEMASVGRGIAEETQTKYSAQRDMFPLGIGNIVSGCFGGLVGSGSMSATAANRAAGGQTAISPLTAALGALVVVLFAGDAVASLPEAALAVLIIHAVSHHLGVRFLASLRHFSRPVLVLAVIAAAGVIFLDVLPGLLLAMFCNLVWFLHKTTKLTHWRVGPSSKDDAILVRDDSPTYTAPPPEVAAVRFGGQAFYGNISRLGDTLKDMAGEFDNLKAIIIDLESQDDIDYTSIQEFEQLGKQLKRQGIWLVAVGVRDNVLDRIRRLQGLSGVVVRRSTRLQPVFDDIAAGKRPVNELEERNPKGAPATEA